MPYINSEQREDLEKNLQNLVDQVAELTRYKTMSVLPGVLNYLITSLIKRTYSQSIEIQSYPDEGKMGYGDYNEIIGVLECAKLEFYRRSTAPYEDKKIKENGDV